MKHLGDITKIHGDQVPPVDCIIGGSPCQDLSVAGKRAGLAGERSGLFMEQVRIVKEMRENGKRNGIRTDRIKPRFLVWENVPGAFGSNNGEDFRAVLEEICKVADPEISIPKPPKGKWTSAGCIVGSGYSVAWRTHDAQYWGVPQRRRRISLIADFGGERAHEILFECQSVQGNTCESGTEREEAPRDFAKSTGADDCERGITGTAGFCPEESAKTRGIGYAEEQSPSLRAGVVPAICYGANGTENGTKTGCIVGDHENRVTDRSNIILYPREFGGKVVENAEITPPLEARAGIGGNNRLVICQAADGSLCADDCKGANNQYVEHGKLIVALEGNGSRPSHQGDGYKESDVSYTLNSTEVHGVAYKDEACAWDGSQISPTITANNAAGQQRMPDKENCNFVIALDRASYNQGKNAKFGFEIREDGIQPTETAKGPGAVAYGLGIQSSNGIGSCAEDKMPALIIGDNPGWQNGVCHAIGVDCYNQCETGDKAKSITCAATDSNHIPCVIDPNIRYIVRRLTPLECERLQGYPDGWTDIGDYTDTKGKKCKTSDAARYKALGNSIALPFWKWLTKRISAEYIGNPTMASLFDGIGGFPLCWEQINGAGTCLWASEIEEFPIAVTKKRIGGEK